MNLCMVVGPTIIQTCLGMQIGRIVSVKVISLSRMYIAKSCDSLPALSLKFGGTLVSVKGKALHWIVGFHMCCTYYRNNNVVGFSCSLIFLNFLLVKSMETKKRKTLP